MVAEKPYMLPEREGNPHWPMPPDYGPRNGKQHTKGQCIRCNAKSPHKHCDACRAARRNMRLALMQGWYDHDEPGFLMRIDEPEIFLEAMKFGTDFYFKRSINCGHQYFLPDCRHKTTMQSMFCRPRSALVAPRESGKTFTLIFEMAPLMAICRPNTPILLGSETKDLTVEKIKEVRRRIERNARIEADFGKTYPLARSSALEWNNKCLDFRNGSNIRGSSIDQSTRGRHPLVGLIDDPEGKRAKNPAWRDSFMRWLFQDYLNQFRDRGTHVMWIGTILDIDSCLWRAVHNEDEENRFVAWERHILKMVYEDPDRPGRLVSAWPEKITVDQFERKKTGQKNEDGTVTPIGLAAVMAEFQGAPIPHGELVFSRDLHRNSYILHESGGERCIYNLGSGKSRTLADMLRECHIVGGVDVADTPENSACKSGIVVMLYDADGVFWVIDAWTDRCFSDQTAIQSMRMAHDWRMHRMAWETVALSRRITREVFKLRKQRLHDGFHVPQLIDIATDGIGKALRIERMRPNFEAGNIKLPVFKEHDGVVPCKFPRRAHMQELLNQIDVMTMEHKNGIDLLDAMEMAHRITFKPPKRLKRENPGLSLIREWEEQGMHVDPMQAHPSLWTKRMKDEFQSRVMPMRDESDYEVCDAFG